MLKLVHFISFISALMLVAAFGLQTPAATLTPGTAVSGAMEPLIVDTPTLTVTPTPIPSSPLDAATQKELQSFEDGINNSTWGLRDPSYEDLMYFLIMNDKSQDVVYNDTYDCMDFAAAVKNNSEANGIRGYYLGLIFWDRTDGHLINAWHTLDAGWVYVDCCGFDAAMVASGNWSFKAQVYPVAGKQYLKMAPKGVNYPVKGFGWGRIREIILFRDMDGQGVRIGKSSPYS